jgi:hypothetical protein
MLFPLLDGNKEQQESEVLDQASDDDDAVTTTDKVRPQSRAARLPVQLALSKIAKPAFNQYLAKCCSSYWMAIRNNKNLRYWIKQSDDDDAVTTTDKVTTAVQGNSPVQLALSKIAKPAFNQ